MKKNEEINNYLFMYKNENNNNNYNFLILKNDISLIKIRKVNIGEKNKNILNCFFIVL